jgi:hypothetical protein
MPPAGGHRVGENIRENAGSAVPWSVSHVYSRDAGLHVVQECPRETLETDRTSS